MVTGGAFAVSFALPHHFYRGEPLLPGPEAEAASERTAGLEPRANLSQRAAPPGARAVESVA